jgi:prepilin-type N-terminal cleavage/methylation domain-containing protein
VHRAFPTATEPSHTDGGPKGFTMIEVLAVLLVLAVIITVVLTRTPSIERNAFAQAAVIRSHLRFAQSLAMGDNTENWGITFTPHSYTLLLNGSPAGIALPNDDSSTHNLPGSVTITGGIGTVLFDEWGSPGPDNIAITVDTESIVITRLTGFIP